MHVVSRGIKIWTLYTLVSCVSIGCLSTAGKVRWELVYDPMPDERIPDERIPDERILDQRILDEPMPDEPLSDELVPYETNFEWLPGQMSKRLEHRVNDNDASAVNVGKRLSNVCDCTANHQPVDLGTDHLPSLLPSIECIGDQWCKKTSYPVPVLRRRKSANPLADNVPFSRDYLPESLRADWRVVYVNVTVACYCPYC